MWYFNQSLWFISIRVLFMLHLKRSFLEIYTKATTKTTTKGYFSNKLGTCSISKSRVLCEKFTLVIQVSCEHLHFIFDKYLQYMGCCIVASFCNKCHSMQLIERLASPPSTFTDIPHYFPSHLLVFIHACKSLELESLNLNDWISLLSFPQTW